MTAEELMERLKEVPPHYEIMIWNESAGDWDPNIQGKLLAQDNIGLAPNDEDEDKQLDLAEPTDYTNHVE